MFYNEQVTEIFCLVDEFCKEYDKIVEKKLLGNPSKRPPIMSKSEVITIMALFHLSGYRCFKHFYLERVKLHMKADFPRTVSYNRFVELMGRCLLPMTLFLKTTALGNCTGISFADSTKIRVCHNKRIKRNRVFDGAATTGKSTMGWFHGFKLHLLINEKGDILEFCISQAHVDDREPLKKGNFLKKIFGKIYADKGYIGKELMQTLFADGIHLVTQIRNNMKNQLMTVADKIMLRKRSLIETVNDELKNICQVEHSRHRSIINFVANLISGLLAYCFLPKKPAIRGLEKTDQLCLF